MIKKYTPNKEIKMIVSEKEVSIMQIKRLLSENGIFSMARNANELANEIYPIFLGCEDINRIQQMLECSQNYQKSSIMTLKPINSKEKLEVFVDLLGDEFSAYKSKGIGQKYQLEDIHKDLKGNLYFKMIYIKKVKGKIDLLQDKKKEIEVHITPRESDHKLMVDIRQNDNTDLKEFDLFISQFAKADNPDKLFNVGYINLGQLTLENKITFFDKLIAYKHKNWKIVDIKGVDVKKENSTISEGLEDDEAIDEGIDSSIAQNDLLGINSAVFKGNGIRDVGIVQKFLKEKFYFTSMKMKFEYINDIKSFIVDINFKTIDNIKIDIINTYEEDVDSSRELVSVFSKKEQNLIIKEFQEVTYNIYNELIKEQTESIRP